MMMQTPSAEAISAIDNEHKVQVALLDALTDSLSTNTDLAQIEGIMSQVADYSSVHFLSEQLLMRLHAYPGYEGHLQEHDRMLESFDAASAVLAQRPLDRDRAETCVAEIRAELLQHIADQDAELHAWLEKEGIGEISSVGISTRD